MKKWFTAFALLLGVSTGAQAQLVISEIMFNPPESNTDSLEFIEIYNAGSSSVDLNGHYISFGGQNIRDTFNGSFTLAAGELVVTAVNDSAVMRQFSLAFTPRQWRSNAGLGNTGTTIRLHNSTGAVIDSVAYQGAWQAQANGLGASLILCNPANDNNVSTNWASSSASTGITINGNLLKGSPGVLESCATISYPLRSIASLRGVNAAGAPDSLNVYCEIRGVVHSVDYRGGTGFDFALIDGSNTGITVFSAAGVSGYNVQRGDSLHVRGFVSQFNCGTQFAPDSIQVASAANAEVTPEIISAPFVESKEGKLVKLENVVLVDTTVNTAAGVNIRVVNSALDTFEVRFDNDTDAFMAAMASDSFNVTGVCRQISTEANCPAGYQLMVRGIADVEFLGVVIGVEETANAAALRLFPNPTRTTLNVESSRELLAYSITNALGQQVAAAANLAGTQTQISVSELPTGIYQISVKTTEGWQTRKFVVTK